MPAATPTTALVASPGTWATSVWMEEVSSATILRMAPCGMEATLPSGRRPMASTSRARRWWRSLASAKWVTPRPIRYSTCAAKREATAMIAHAHRPPAQPTRFDSPSQMAAMLRSAAYGTTDRTAPPAVSRPDRTIALRAGLMRVPTVTAIPCPPRR